MPVSKRHLRRRLKLRRSVRWLSRVAGHRAVFQVPDRYAPVVGKKRLVRRLP